MHIHAATIVDGPGPQTAREGLSLYEVDVELAQLDGRELRSAQDQAAARTEDCLAAVDLEVERPAEPELGVDVTDDRDRDSAEDLAWAVQW